MVRAMSGAERDQFSARYGVRAMASANDHVNLQRNLAMCAIDEQASALRADGSSSGEESASAIERVSPSRSA